MGLPHHRARLRALSPTLPTARAGVPRPDRVCKRKYPDRFTGGPECWGETAPTPCAAKRSNLVHPLRLMGIRTRLLRCAISSCNRHHRQNPPVWRAGSAPGCWPIRECYKNQSKSARDQVLFNGCRSGSTYAEHQPLSRNFLLDKSATQRLCPIINYARISSQ